MISRICDRCGQPLEDGALRFTAKIHLFAAYDPLDITFEDMTRDHEQEIRKIAAECKGMTEEELMEDVYLEFKFDLCPPCKRAYARDPMPVAQDPQSG